MVNEGMLDMLDKFFSAVDYTAPTFYFGLGTAWPGVFFDETDTAAKMTTGVPNPPVTNDFTDAGGRTALDFSAGAVNISGRVTKFAPPILNFSQLIIAPGTDISYIISAPGVGSTPPPAVLSTLNGFAAPGPNPGDILEVTVSVWIYPS